MLQKPITIPSRSHSAKLLLRLPCQSETPFCVSFPSALCLARAQRKEAMGDRKISSIRLSFFCNKARCSVCERPPSPAVSAGTTNKAADSRPIIFVRAFILETLHPSPHNPTLLHDAAILENALQPFHLESVISQPKVSQWCCHLPSDYQPKGVKPAVVVLVGLKQAGHCGPGLPGIGVIPAARSFAWRSRSVQRRARVSSNLPGFCHQRGFL